MSSPRKYRGLRADNGEWVKGFLAAPDQIMTWDEELGVGSMIQVIPESVGQDTGLKDKDGVDLDWYAGDIIQKGEIIRAITVDWEHGMRFMLGKHILCKQDGINGTKLGDIHTTPELLEDK